MQEYLASDFVCLFVCFYFWNKSESPYGSKEANSS